MKTIIKKKYVGFAPPNPLSGEVMSVQLFLNFPNVHILMKYKQEGGFSHNVTLDDMGRGGG